MVNTISTASWVIGGWLAAVTIVIVASVALGAHLSTTALLGALAMAPGIVVALLANRRPSPSVAQMLHSTEKESGRS